MGISWKEALECFQSDDLIGIGMEADSVRRRLHPEGVVSYTIDGRINYTNIAGSADFEPLCDRIAGIVAMGGTSVTLQGEGNTPPAQSPGLTRSFAASSSASPLYGCIPSPQAKFLRSPTSLD